MSLFHKLTKQASSISSVDDIKDILNKYTYSDDVDNWISKDPSELVRLNKGICFDTASLQEKLLSDLGVEHKSMFAVSKDSINGKNYSDPSHTFVIYKDADDGLWKWMEGSWEPHRNNTISSKTSKELSSKVRQLLEQANGKPYRLSRIKRYPKSGLTIGDYYLQLLEQARKQNVKKHKGRQKKASFSDVKAIYDSLPEEQKRLLSPRGYMVDSPFTSVRYVTPDKDGFSEAYEIPSLGKHKAFVTIGVKPDSQGKGLSKKILKQLIQEARAKKIKELIYRADNSNEASQRLDTFFAGQPARVMEDSSEWCIKIPQGKKDKIFDAVVKAYKDKHGFDLSHMVMEPTDKARFSDSTINENIPDDEVGGSWARNNTIYVGNNLDKVVKKYGLDMSPEEFKKHIIAHELAHEIDNNLASDKFRKKILEQAAKEKFTTPYLEGYKDDDPKKKEEIFAEYLAKSLM